VHSPKTPATVAFPDVIPVMPPPVPEFVTAINVEAEFTVFV
jgi:hypothetical protein